MPVTGELIRLMNYVDDITAALRRVKSHVPTMSAEERTALVAHMRKSSPGYAEVMAILDEEVK